jgi:SNF2 family DNA or RNA helicase
MTEESSSSAAADFHLDLGVFKKALADRSLQTKNHQLDGVKWCVRNETKGNVIERKTVHGGIVADEMGLGKTIQMVGVIITHFLLHTLIIVPKAILEQWESEIFKLTSHRAFVYHGTNRKNYAKLNTSPIVITTYGMISNPSSELFKLKWDRAIFDEAHHLKNKNTRIYAGAINLKADIKWAVTGTPIQNNKTDFYNICAVLGVDRGMFSKDEEGVSGFEKCRQIVLKRTKREVGIQMADVTCETINITWGNKSEKKLAENIHSMTQFSLPRRYQTRQQYKEQQQQEEKQNKQKTHASAAILPFLLKAKQMCVFPALINKPFRITPNQELSIINGTTHTTKIDSLIQTIIDRKENKRPKLIFCHFRGEIDIIKQRLESDFDVQVIDGRTTDKQKKEILKNAGQAQATQAQATQAQAQAMRIQTRQAQKEKETEKEKKSKILILQIQTGCEGLNLQEYNEVYFVSPHWNPAVESQAIARCHRIGQTHGVDVFRFVMTWNDPGFKSMDEYCEQVQEAKQKMYSDFFSQPIKL